MKNKFALLFVTFLVLIASLAAVPVRVSAEEVSPPVVGEIVVVAPEEPSVVLPTITDLQDFVEWLIGPGAFFAVSWFLSFLADKFKWWAKVPHDVKVILPVLLVGLLVWGGTALLQNLPPILLDPTLNKILLLILGYLATQKQHARFEAAAG